MKRIAHIFSLIVLLSIVSFPQAWEVIQGDITSDRTLTSNRTYLLRGFVRVQAPAVLTIQPGTIIYGENTTQGTLIIKPGARINANGTAARPIVFTSEFARIGSTKAPVPGDWGGLIVLGNGILNVPGGTASIEGPGDTYGGTNANDNSGTIRYVRIEYSGIAFSLNNEINSLTMGGVGAGTTIEYVQVSYANDDAFEWFGGNVNAKYLVAYRTLDDDFDTDFGYNGKLQYLVALRDPRIADVSGSNSFESDNDGTGSTNSPLTSPTWWNVTLIGPSQAATDTINALYRRGMHLRRNSQNKISNALIVGWRTGILLDGNRTISGAIASTPTMWVRNSIIVGATTRATDTTAAAGAIITPNTWFTGSNGRILAAASDAQLTAPFNLASPNFLPLAGSPALTGGATPPNDGFFDVTATHVGAFGATNWMANWTNFNPVNYPVSTKENSVAVENFYLAQNYPNPFNPSTQISFTLAKRSNVTLKVYNSLAQEVAEIVNGNLIEGNHTINFDASGLSAGVYFYQLRTSDFTSTKKMTLLK